MPYIKQEQRRMYSPNAYGMEAAETTGQLNYQITEVIVKYLHNHPKITYGVMNDIIGALESAKLEFYRRVVAPYENTKCEENGDVY